MIKLLFFIDTTLSSGGAEKVLRTLVNHLDPTRFDITVMTAWPEDASRYLLPHIHYKSLYPARNRFWRTISRIEAQLGLTYRLRMAGEYDIEVAYLEFGPTKVLSSSTNRKAKKLAWIHCDLSQTITDPESFRRKCGSWYRAYDRVVCVSGSVKDSFDRLMGCPEQSCVLHNVVDSRDILDRANCPLPSVLQKRRTTFITVGRLYPVKGYDRLLRIHSRLLQEGWDHDLWILGEGPLRGELEDYIREQGLTDSVRMPGFLNNPYAPMAAADTVVCSSHSEGLSTMVTEALILGKPVVTTDCSGMAELLGDSEYGLITENSEEALYEGMKRLFSNPALRRHYADAAELRGTEFRREALIGKTEAFFTELLEGTNTQ